MIKVFLKYVLYLLFFIVTLIFFLPKENLYYLLEKKLVERNIIISKENIENKRFSFSINAPTVFYNEMEVLKIADINIVTSLITSNINMNNIKITSEFKSFIPENIDFIEMKYSIFNPLIVEWNSKGEFGILMGEVDLLKSRLTFHLKASKKMESLYKNILIQMKLEQGEYVYEYNY